ncbi:hypothetical protein [Rubinisphaera italica]|uniref:Uncharacterized protein n=1 Tax=Rubinisphaera italica TaxID=2527969 RepID=A0A5C5XE55_9PLAN|nr:hypothetical protein [Rubinisphaera italica]TWT61290.1 hypothetical protein Pan54_20260 [Rubinisphaera italica]
MTANSEMTPERKYVIGMLSPQPLDAHTAMKRRNQHVGKFKDQSASRKTYHPTPYSPQQIKTILKGRARETIPASETSENAEQADASNTIFRAILLICLPIIFFSLKSCLHRQDHYQVSYVNRREEILKFPKAEPFNPTKHFATGTNSAPVWTLTQDPRHQDAVKRIFYGKMPYEDESNFSRVVKDLRSIHAFAKLIQLMETSLRNRQNLLRQKIFLKNLTVGELDEYVEAETAYLDSVERLSKTKGNGIMPLNNSAESLTQPAPEQATTTP